MRKKLRLSKETLTHLDVTRRVFGLGGFSDANCPTHDLICNTNPPVFPCVPMPPSGPFTPNPIPTFDDSDDTALSAFVC